MKYSTNLICIIFSLLFISCNNLNDENNCVNKQILLNPNKGLKLIDISLEELNDSLLFDKGFDLNCIAPEKQEFNIPVNNIFIKTHIERTCCLCVRKFKPSIHISLNSKGKVWINNGIDTIIEIKEIPIWFDDNFQNPFQEENGILKQITFKWSNNVSKEDIYSSLLGIIDGYSICVEKKSMEKYGEELCNLDTLELKLIKEIYPFELKLSNFNSDNLPPILVPEK